MIPTEFESLPATGKFPSTVNGVKVPEESLNVKPAKELL